MIEHSMPAIDAESLKPIEQDKLLTPARKTQAPCILLLYSSLHAGSFSRLATEKAA